LQERDCRTATGIADTQDEAGMGSRQANSISCADFQVTFG
jgi:hypothetical protein